MRIAPGDLSDARVNALVERHLAFCREASPICSVHAYDQDNLAGDGVEFFVLWDGDSALACGALDALPSGDGELKSMHVVAEARGRGLAGRMLDHLLERARARGMARVWLETGSQEVFGPARGLYRASGFEVCPPFEDYVEDPNSVFMTRGL